MIQTGKDNSIRIGVKQVLDRILELVFMSVNILKRNEIVYRKEFYLKKRLYTAFLSV